MPRAIKTKTGHGRTAVNIPFTPDVLMDSAQKLVCDDYPETFTHTELDAFLEKLSIVYGTRFFDDTRPQEPEKKAALKRLQKVAGGLLKAAHDFQQYLEELDIDTRKYFTIKNLEDAEQSTELVYRQACVAANDLKNRAEKAGRPTKTLKNDVALAVINELDAKFPHRIIKIEPSSEHGIRKQYARYDENCRAFAKTLMCQAFPRTKDDAIRKIIESTINKKFNF